MIEAHDIGKMFGAGEDAVGLRELSLSVPRGRVLALLGHNGAGKTTAVSCLSTLLPLDRGTARVAGFDVTTEARRVRERIALVGQALAVDEQLTARQNLVLFGRLRGLDRGTATTRAGLLLDDVGLGEDEDRPVRTFSGGMRRRLDVAASLVVRPEVLFVDEPTTGLDPAGRRDLWRTLRGLVADGTTLLLTTQYLEEADALADHIVLLAHGRVVAEGTSDQLKDALGPPLISLRFADPSETVRAGQVLGRFEGYRPGDATTATLPATRPESLLECVRALGDLGISPTEVTLRKPSLDEVFHHHITEEAV